MQIDPRGPRFGARSHDGRLAVVLVTGSGWLLAVQALFFAIGAVLGLRTSPYGSSTAGWSGPGWDRPASSEAAAPPRFAQGVAWSSASSA